MAPTPQHGPLTGVLYSILYVFGQFWYLAIFLDFSRQSVDLRWRYTLEKIGYWLKKTIERTIMIKQS